MSPTAAPSAAVVTQSYGTSGFAGAALASRERGMVYWPTLDTRREVSSYSRTELLRKSRYLYANVGFVRRIINGLSRMVVGQGLSPQARTSDPIWNALAEKSFEARATSRGVFDLAGKYNFYQMQRAIQRCKLKDGDCAIVLTESAAGSPRYALYESHQIGGGENGFEDGVKVDSHNGATAYQLLGDGGQRVPISANDLIFFADYERPGQNRGLTCLYHAINNLLDTSEILAFMKQGVKLSNQIGYYIKRQADQTGGPTVKPRNVQSEAVTVSGDRVKLEKLFGGGKIEELQPGESIELLHDDRPHPNMLGGLNYLNRDIAWGVGVSPEVLWMVEELGGANMRFILADAQVYIEEQQQELVDIFCSRVWIYHIAKEMKAGRLPRCKDPEWWKHSWTPPQRMTVDFGKDGKIYIDQVRSGALTFRRFYEWQGLDAESERGNWLAEMAALRADAIDRGLDPDKVVDLVYGRPGISANAPANPESNPVTP